jgi:hypothetical protein
MSKLKTEATLAVIRMINFEVETPRCKTCEHHYQQREGRYIFTRCMKYNFKNHSNGLCDFWVDSTTGRGLAS